MATAKQVLGAFGEQLVARYCSCPTCKRSKTLVRLPQNFKCADIICDFCGFLAQVKTSASQNIETLPRTILGAAWMPQKERMDAAIYFPLYLVLSEENFKHFAIYYLSADLQTPELFKERRPLSKSARRAGWKGFSYNIRVVANRLVRLL